MVANKYTPGEISRRGKEIYQKKIKQLVEPQEKGKFIVIDVESDDYEVDDEATVASDSGDLRLLAFWGRWVTELLTA